MTPLPKDLQSLHGFFMIMSFVLGTTVGSFCNVCISRWPAGLSIVKPRSRCPKCMNEIPWYDNIPLVSWVLLRAKCRNCDLPISIIYPTVELITGLLFLAAYWRFGYAPATPVYMALCAGMVIVTFQDLADWTIPDEITLPGIPIGIALSLAGMLWGDATGLRVQSVFDALLGVLAGGGILFALDRITVLLLKKPGMGMGDVKLLAMLGAFLGWKGAIGTLMMASVIGSVIGISVLLYYRKRGGKNAPANARPEAEPAKKKDAGDSDEEITLEGHYLPFGPYLAVAGLIYMFFGPELINWYLASLGPSSSVVVIR
jgi:leader peptidase (prepilin peptidase)/N-methyltransferase